MNTYDIAQMGYGEADITPETFVELVGFFRPNNHSKGVRDPLKLQTMVWKYRGETSCLITLDSLGFTVHLSSVLRGLIADLLHTGADHVMSAFSHTHSAPNAAEEPEYFDFVCRMAQNAVKDALKGLSPAFAPWLTGDTPEESRARVEAFDQLFRAAVSDTVSERMGGFAPAEPVPAPAFDRERLRGMSPREINAHWAEIQDTLKG